MEEVSHDSLAVIYFKSYFKTDINAKRLVGGYHYLSHRGNCPKTSKGEHRENDSVYLQETVCLFFPFPEHRNLVFN